MKLLDTFFNTFKPLLGEYLIWLVMQIIILYTFTFLLGTCTTNPDISSSFRFLSLLCCCLIRSHSSINGSFLAFCFDVRWFTISFAWKAGFSLADSFAARSFASTPGFFLAFCFEARWCSFSLDLKAGICLTDFFQHILLLLHLAFLWLSALKHAGVLFHLL